MLRSSKLTFSWRDPRFTARVVLGLLLLANLVAVLIVLKPWGGSPEDLQRQVVELRTQLRQRTSALERMKTLSSKAGTARTEGDHFLNEFFLLRRTAYSTLIGELGQSARTAGIKPKGDAFNDEPVEGSDNLGMLTIVASFEGSYADLIQFINLLDRSPRLMIIDSLQASPQQGSGLLNVGMKFHTFVRDAALPESAAAGGSQ